MSQVLISDQADNILLHMIHQCRGSHSSVGQLRQGTATATRPVPCPGACTASCPSCLCVLCTCLRVPCLRLCAYQPACEGRYRVPARACGACAGPLCANALHLFARAFSVPARVLRLHLVDIFNCGEFSNPIDSCSS